MKYTKVILILFVLVISFSKIAFCKKQADPNYAKNRLEAQKLFLEASVAVTEGKYEQACATAEKLLEKHVGDYETSLYVHLYSHTFRFVDPNYRKDDSDDSHFISFRNRKNAIKANRQKDVLCYVKLSAVSSLKESIECYQKIINEFPDSLWIDWAKWKLANAQIEINEDKYLHFQDKKFKDVNEEFNYYDKMNTLFFREFYNMGKKFMEDNPNSYMLPQILCAVTRWGEISKIAPKEERISMYNQLLRDYNESDYYCAVARTGLRGILYNDFYKNMDGYSGEEDIATLLFWCSKPWHGAFVEEVKGYLKMKEQKAGQTP